MLARAFLNDPTSVLAYPDERERQTRLHYIYEFLLRYYIGYVEAYTTSDKLEGISIWQRYSSQISSLSFWHFILSGAIWPALRIGITTSKSMQPFMEYVENKHREMVPDLHWYLVGLGVDPEYQGQGCASRLLRPKLARIEAEGLSCYLETATEKNVAMYQHLGFKVIEDFIIPGTTVKLWGMLKDKKNSG